jgi:hypothetical protein
MSIPASNIVPVNPGVLSAGGNPLSLNTLFMTQNILMPTNTVFSFPGPTNAAVSNFFGPGSAEAAQAAIYFSGYTGGTLTPSTILFAPFNLSSREAFITSAPLTALTLTQLQALSGDLIITVNGLVVTSTAINFAGVASFSAAATLITTGFDVTGDIVATWNAVNSTFILTTTTQGNTSVISFASGTLASSLNLTQASGAFLSQGVVNDVPNSAMNNAIANSQNFVSFITLWEPTVTDKVNFAIWSNGQNNRYLYLGWDSDGGAAEQDSPTSFGPLALAAGYNGVAAISGSAADVPVGSTLAQLALNVASFVGGTIASINFAQTNGNITLAFRNQAGLLPTCTDATAAANLIANGYSFYGQYATANQKFTFLYNGNMPGIFEWINDFVNQVFMNSQFQLDDMNLLTQVGTVPYDPTGYALLRASKQGTIDTMLNYGGIQTGVVLSPAEIAEVNQEAGVNAAAILQTNGYYLQILDPGATVRAARGTPIQNFWYTSGGSVQKLVLSSIEVQ